MVTEILAKVDFLELVSRRVSLSHVNDTSYRGLSPFTNERTPSFFVNPKSKTWYDFSSGTGGGVLDYVMRTESIDRGEALAMLADMVGVELEENDHLSNLRAILKTANEYFLYHAQDALPYMTERGFSEETMKRYGIGFSPRGTKLMIDHLHSKGYTDEDILESGLGYRDAENRLLAKYQNRVIFPIKDTYGTIVSFTGRAVGNSPAKYLHGTTTRLFKKKEIVWNLSSVRRLISDKNMVIVCEGQMDALAVCDAGLPGVAILGSMPSHNQIKLLGGASSNIYFIFDSDAAGEKALLEAFKIAEDTGIDSLLHSITLPEGEDPNSYLNNHSVEEFLELVRSATPDTSAVIRSLINQHLDPKLTRAQVAGKVIRELAPFVKNKLTYRSLDLIERAAQEFSVNQKELRSMIERRNSVPPVLTNDNIREISFPAPVYERRILYALLDNPVKIMQFKSTGLTIGDFESDLVSRVVDLIDPKLDSSEMFEELRGRLEEDEYYSVLEFFSKGMDGDLESALDVMKGIVLKRVRDSRNNFIGRPIPDSNFTREKRRELKAKITA